MLLKKYYKSVIIKNHVTTNKGAYFLIICTNFFTISKIDKNKINHMIYEYFNKINDNMYIIKLLSINTSKYIHIKNSIRQINEMLYLHIIHILNIYNNIYNNKFNKQKLIKLLFIKFIHQLILNI